MSARRHLEKAILRNDTATIRQLVEKHGSGLLEKKLPGSFSRGHRQPGDRWLKRVFKNPPALTLALLMGDDDTVATLVQCGAHPRLALDYNFPNQLFVAAALGRLRVLDGWLQTYATLAEARNHDNDHLLHIAAQHGQPDIVALLIRDGRFSLSARSQTLGCTPLKYALRIRHAACAALLLEAEMNLRAAPLSDRPQPKAAAPAVTERWHVIDDQSVARLSVGVPPAGALADIFNFSTGDLWRLNRARETAR